MRRLLLIALAVLIGLPSISPLVALSGAADLTRPMCCRRDGKHHCMLVDMDGGPSARGEASTTAVRFATVSERCPYGSATLPITGHSGHGLRVAFAIFAGVVAHPSVAPQTESKRRVSADRSKQKRGPPAIFLS